MSNNEQYTPDSQLEEGVRLDALADTSEQGNGTNIEAQQGQQIEARGTANDRAIGKIAVGSDPGIRKFGNNEVRTSSGGVFDTYWDRKMDGPGAGTSRDERPRGW